MSSDLEPLPPDIEGLLKKERSMSLPAEHAAALSSRVLEAMRATPPFDDLSELPEGAPAPAPAPVLTAKTLALVAAGTIFGGFTGAGIHAALTKPPPPAPAPVVAVAPVVPAVAPPPVVDAPPVAPEEEEELVEQPTPSSPEIATPKKGTKQRTKKGTLVPVVTSDEALAQERSIIETARAALSRGRAEEALAETERHAAMFPTGRLAEERESLAIQALMTVGRTSEARQRAATFQQQHPRSLLLPLIRKLMATP